MTSRADRAGQSEHFLEAAEWKEELRAMIGGNYQFFASLPKTTPPSAFVTTLAATSSLLWSKKAKRTLGIQFLYFFFQI